MSNSQEEPEEEKRPPVGFTVEGGGVVATCKGCGWAVWKPTRQEAEKAPADHKTCRSDLVKLHRRLARSRGAVYRPRPA